MKTAKRSRSKKYQVRDDCVPGIVYLLQDKKGLVKIGLTRNLAIRKRQLEKDWGKLQIIEAVPTQNMRKLELKMHKEFHQFNVYRGKRSGGTEFFRLSGFQLWKAQFVLHCWSNSQKPMWFWFVAGMIGLKILVDRVLGSVKNK